MAIGTSLLTAEEYIDLPDSFDGPTELVKGVLIEISPPRPRHGEICFRTGYLLAKFLEDHPIGRIISNDASMVTGRAPDTVRGPDISYYSYDRVPKGPLPGSPTDRWTELHIKFGEYLAVGVRAVCILDDDTQNAHAFFADRDPQVLSGDDELALPEILGEFSVAVRQFFD
jgi:Uma2 family endonuclease